MSQKISKTRSFKIAYLLNQSGCQKIINILKEVSTDLNVEIECSDGSLIQYSSTEELFNFTNSSSKQIQSLLITTPWGKESHISVRFQSLTYQAPIYYEISGDDKNVFYLSEKLDECIFTFRLWYTPFAFLDFVIVLFGGILLFIYTLLIWSIFYLSSSNLSEVVGGGETKEDLLIKNIIWLSFGTLVLISIGINFFRNKLFPFANFLIGEGINKFKKLEFWRRTIGVGFLLSIIASTIASLII